MTHDDDATVRIVTERFERRLAEDNGELRVEMTAEFGRVRTEMATESGKTRAEMAAGFGALRSEMHSGFGQLRVEMIERTNQLLKWILLLWATQLAAISGLLALFR